MEEDNGPTGRAAELLLQGLLLVLEFMFAYVALAQLLYGNTALLFFLPRPWRLLAWYGCTAAWMLLRYPLGMWQGPPLNELRRALDRRFWGLLFASLLLFGCFALCQAVSNNWLLSLENLLIVDTESQSPYLVDRIDWSRLFQLVIFSPLLEELVFRGMLLPLLLPPLALRTRSRCVRACWLAGGAFGLFHLPNLLSAAVHPVYGAFQMTMAVLVGALFSMHLDSRGALWQPCALHCANNLTAVFVPLSLNLLDAGPLFAAFAGAHLALLLSALYITHNTYLPSPK